MEKKHLVVLDIDDTLTSSEKKHTDSLLFAMREFGIVEVDTDWRNYANATDSYIFKTNYEKTHSKEFSLDLIKEFEEIMTSHFLSYKDSEEILGASSVVDFFLNETNYGVCYATGSLLQPALLKLKQAEIPFYSDVLEVSNTIFTREEIVKSAINKAEHYFKVERFEQIISFGDGLWDATTAENLGVHFVGVNTKNVEDFKKQGVQYHINTWNDFDLQKTEEIFKII